MSHVLSCHHAAVGCSELATLPMKKTSVSSKEGSNDERTVESSRRRKEVKQGWKRKERSVRCDDRACFCTDVGYE